DSAIEACYRCRPFEMHVGAPVKQHIQYATSSDGVRIAYAAMGQGTPVVRASHWLTHLEYELDSPVWRHLILGMASRHKFIRYDGRGTGRQLSRSQHSGAWRHSSEVGSSRRLRSSPHSQAP